MEALVHLVHHCIFEGVNAAWPILFQRRSVSSARGVLPVYKILIFFKIPPLIFTAILSRLAAI
jgi:hypothetical protein